MSLRTISRAALLALLLAPSGVLAQGCPPLSAADAICRSYHGPSAVWTGGGCLYAECFEMSYGEAGRAHTMGDETLFPKLFFMWTPGTPNGYTSCQIEQSGNKFKLEIPAGSTRCRTDFLVGSQTYHQHFASNPSTGCLVWMECKIPPP